MTTIKLSLLISFTFFAISKSQNFDHLAPLKNGLDNFFHTGHASESFRQQLQANAFPHLFREGMEQVYDNPTVCYLCNLVVDLVVGERYLGLSKESLSLEAALLCKELQIENERVCKGVIDLNIDVFLYIIDNYQNFTSNRVCGSVLQSYGCLTGNAFEWSVDVASGNSIERPKPNDTESPTFNILHLSDIHYDPDYTPNGNANCGEPICCQSDQGEPDSKEDACGYWSDYRNGDSPWHLVEETVRQAKAQQQFDYVYFTGDIISHRVWETSIPNNTDSITKLYSYFKEQFDVPVFPVFGNHEPHPLDLWPSDHVDISFSMNWLFEIAAKHWTDLIGQDVSETVLKGGYYSVSPKPGFRIIALNSNVCYITNFWLIFEDRDPYGQLQWLADTLEQAEANNETVHILSHVPTGEGSSLKVWNREFSKIVERFANTITGQFYGHTHQDKFYVYYNSSDAKQPISVALNGGSVTPFGGSNPSYKYYTVDQTTNNLLDFEEWYLNLTLANSIGPADSAQWEKLYTFTETYGVKSLVPSEVDQVLYIMAQNHTLLEVYNRYKYRNGASSGWGCDDNCKKSNLCDIVVTVYGNNEQCNNFMELYDQNS